MSRRFSCLHAVLQCAAIIAFASPDLRAQTSHIANVRPAVANSANSASGLGLRTQSFDAVVPRGQSNVGRVASAVRPLDLKRLQLADFGDVDVAR